MGKKSASIAKWRAANPEKSRAHELLRLAVRHGRVRRPGFCEHCEGGPSGKGPAGAMHGHHWDHTEPLAVEWVCAHCHLKLPRGEKHDENRVATSWRMGVDALTGSPAPSIANADPEHLNWLLRSVSDEERTAVVLHVINGLTIRVVAGAMGVSTATINVWCQGALARLRERFAGREEEAA